MKYLKPILLALTLASCSPRIITQDFLDTRTEQAVSRFPELTTNSKALTELVFKEQGLTLDKALEYPSSFNYEAVQVLYKGKVSASEATKWDSFSRARGIHFLPGIIVGFEESNIDTSDVSKVIDRYPTKQL